MWPRKILGLDLPVLTWVGIGWLFSIRGAWVVWLWKEGDKELIESDMMKYGKFGSMGLDEGNLWDKSVGNMVEDELMTSFSCGVGELNDGNLVSHTWVGQLVKWGGDVEVFGSMSGIEVMMFGLCNLYVVYEHWVKYEDLKYVYMC